MTDIIIGAGVLWLLLPVPLAIACGRAFGEGQRTGSPEGLALPRERDRV